MNKKYLMVLVVAMFIAGCAGEQQVDTVGKSPYIGGNKGLISEFLQMGVFNDESSMEEIFDGESFPIEVVIKNKGEEEIAANKARVTLMGINLADFGLSTPELSNADVIEGVSDLNTEGGEETLDFNDATYSVDFKGSSYDVSVFAKVVYEYNTYTSVPKVCFKKNFNDKTVCDVDEMKDAFSSGAPIRVVSAEEKRAGTGKVGLDFKIENVGTGDVTKPGVGFDTRYDQLAFSVSDEGDWECKSSGREGEARLDAEGKATIICRLKNEITSDVPYTKQLDLILSYDYREIIHKQLRIKKQ